MKKIIKLLTIAFVFSSCESEVKEINSTGGEILMGNNKGSVSVSYTHSPSPRDQRGSRMPSSA